MNIFKKNIKDIIEFKLVENQIQARIYSLELFDKFPCNSFNG